MEALRLKLLSIWIWSATAGIILGQTFLTGLVWILTAPLQRQHALAGRVFRSGAGLVTRAHPRWRHKITGYIPPDLSHGYIIVCNHESHADTILIAQMGFGSRWLAKEGVLRVPFLGWMMQMAGDIPVKRQDKESRHAAMAEMAKSLQEGISVMIFPEGTRSTTSTLGAFKDGAFKLAVETQAPIVPMVLTGCGAALPKGGWVLGQARSYARLHVLPPIYPDGLTAADVPVLRERVRDVMVEAHTRIMAEVATELESPAAAA